jgi:glutaminyl-tRNA synthetase
VDYKKNSETGEIEEVHCTYDPETRGGWSEDGRKVKGTSHWVSAAHAVEAEVRLYDHLFLTENPGEDKEKDFSEEINPQSLEVLSGCKLEPGLAAAAPGERFQFLRQGYFCVDTKHSASEHLVFNRTVSLKDTWAKIKKRVQK